MSKTIGIPVLVDHDGKGGLALGRGGAGWTVITVDVADVKKTIANIPAESFMPATHRIANHINGVRHDATLARTFGI